MSVMQNLSPFFARGYGALRSQDPLTAHGTLGLFAVADPANSERATALRRNVLTDSSRPGRASRARWPRPRPRRSATGGAKRLESLESVACLFLLWLDCLFQCLL